MLYYAFDPRKPGQSVRPYFFTGDVVKVEALEPPIHRVTFRNVR